MYSSTDNLDDSFNNGFEFSDASIRRGFIRKVYAILTSQLLVTLSVIAIFLFTPGVAEWNNANPGFWIAALVGTFVCLIVLACCENVRRSFPQNFIFLGIFTVLESWLLGAVSSAYDAKEVMIAVGITAAVVFGLTMFAFQTKIDFTMCSGALFVALICLLMFGIFAMIFPGRIVNIVYSSLGALIFSLYIVFDTQLMMGGKHKYSLSPEEYIFAALNLYLDIINLFLFILSLIGEARN